MSQPQDEVIPEPFQRRNSFVFLTNTSLYYLVAPVFYVGVLHAAILKSLETSDAVANLPHALYLWVTPVPVLVAWLWPAPGLLRPLLAGCLVVNGAVGGLVSVLFAVAPREWIIPALIAHAGVIGVTSGVRNMCLWELIGRGLSPTARGRTLGWTFGIGPLFAVLGSCGSQLILSGDFLGLVQISPLPAPSSYILLFGVTCPVMWLCAALVGLAYVPPMEVLESGTRPSEVIGGLRAYFLNRYLAVAAVGFLLTYGGTMIMNNLSLYARDALNDSPENYAGLQLALRFGVKCLAGFALGWLVTRIHAKASLLATTGICLAGVAWALLVPGKWYLLSFGFLGAGELFYVYYLNYIIGCSEPRRMRENTAYTNLLTVTVGGLPLLFGLVSDEYGLRSSFFLAGGILVVALALVTVYLPRSPVAPNRAPPSSQITPS
jgi:hypothetical protein